MDFNTLVLKVLWNKIEIVIGLRVFLSVFEFVVLFDLETFNSGI